MSDDPIKDALKRIPYGFYSITARSEDDLNAMVANWVTQVSFTPRLVAVGIAKDAYTHQLIGEGGVFAVNIFNKDDQDALMPFTKSRDKKPEKMEEASYEAAPETGCPILEGAAAYVECEVVEIVDVGGDHDIVVGKAVNAAVMKEGDETDTLTLPHIGWSYAG